MAQPVWRSTLCPIEYFSRFRVPRFLPHTFVHLSLFFIERDVFMEVFRDRGGVCHVLMCYPPAYKVHTSEGTAFYNFGQPSRGARLQSTGPRVGTASTLVIIV